MVSVFEQQFSCRRVPVCMRVSLRCENVLATYYFGGAEIASIRKHKYGKPKYKTGHFTSMENASMEHASTDVHGWNTQVRKSQVRI